MGTLTQKIQRHDATVMSRPASTGPMIGPISAGMPIKAMAAISSDFSTERTRINRPTGTMSAPPAP